MSLCVICHRREPDRPMVCDGCRVWLPGVIRDIADGYAELTAPETPDPTGLLYEDDGSFAGPAVYDVLPLSAGPVRAPLRGAQVSGSREAPVPVVLDVVDLTAAARLPNPVRSRGYYPTSWWPEDQVGYLPVATRLDQWVRDWITYDRCPGDHLPVPTVTALIGWLSVWLGWACDEHPAVDDFAAEMRELRAALNRANGQVPVLPEVLQGVPCSRCDSMPLHRDPESAYHAECPSCGQLYTEAEYTDWVGLVAASAKRRAA